MFCRLLSALLVWLALTAHLVDAQNETHTAPTLLQTITPGYFPFVNEFLGVLFPLEIIRLQTALGVRFILLYYASDYEVLAACNPGSLSFFGTKDDIPADFCSPLNERILVAYILTKVISSEYPRVGAGIAKFLTKAGLTPLSESRDETTLNGWANVKADRLINYFAKDGFNSLGDATREEFRQAFSDQTGYKPVNPAYLSPDKLIRPLRWQPLTGERDREGDFFSQVHVVPQVGTQVSPLILGQEDFLSRKVSTPYQNPNKLGSISPEDEKTLRTSIMQLFKRSEQMTPKKATLVYFWDSKFLSVGTFNAYYRTYFGYDRSTMVRVGLGEAMAQHDAILLAWKEKVRHDLVRPRTMIRRLFKGEMVRAYRGVGNGIGVIKAEEWEPVIPTQPHSEFPSATAAICKVSLEHMETSLKGYLGNVTLPPYEVDFVSGVVTHPMDADLPDIPDPSAQADDIKSVFQGAPGTVGKISVKFESFEAGIRDCGESRLNGGVHFPHAIPAGFEISKGIGEKASHHMKDLWDGKLPEHCNRCIQS